MSVTLSPSLLSYEGSISHHRDKIEKIVYAGVSEIHVDIMRIPFIDHDAFRDSAVRELYNAFSGRVSFDFHLMEAFPDESIGTIKDMIKKEREKNVITIHREAYREGLGDFNSKDYDLLTHDTGDKGKNDILRKKNGETGKSVEKTLSKIKYLGFQAGLALEPGTVLKNVSDAMKEYIDRLLIMTVRSGEGGQDYNPEMTEKISDARDTFGDIRIQADGGINGENLKVALLAGVQIPVVGSAITEKHDVEKATKYFLKEIKRLESR